MAAMSQIASSSKPGADVGLGHLVGAVVHLQRVVEHRALLRRYVGLAPVGGELVRDERILRADAQDGPVRDHAVLALVPRRDGDDDHLALGLRQALGLVHQRVVVGHEGAEFRRPVREHQEHVRHEAGLFLHGQDPRADVLGQGVQVGDGGAGDGVLRHAADHPPAGRFSPGLAGRGRSRGLRRGGGLPPSRRRPRHARAGRNPAPAPPRCRPWPSRRAW